MQLYRDDEFRMFCRMTRESALRFIQHVEMVVDANEILHLSPREHTGGRPEVRVFSKKLK